MNYLTKIWIVLFIFCSCRDQDLSLSEKEKKTIEVEIEKMLQNYNKDVALKGLTAEFSYLDSTEHFSWVPPGSPIALTYDSVAILLKQNSTRYTHINNTWDHLKINVLSNQLASYNGQLVSQITDTSGITSTLRLVETGILIKRNDGWKLLNGQTAVIE